MNMPNKFINQKNQMGLTIVELMVSMALGLVVILAVTTLLVSSKSTYATLDDAARIQDAGRYALDVIARAVHQASYVNLEVDGAPATASATNSADIRGLDAHSLHSTTPEIQSPIEKSVNGSDVLAIRYFGSGAGENGDGTIVNCAGFSVPALQSNVDVEEERAWSIFYVALDANGEPELRCKYRGKKAWSSVAIVRGVESFQILYGIDTEGQGVPAQYLSAAALDQLDTQLILDGPNALAREADRLKKSNWKKIVSIKAAMLIRGTQKTRIDQLKNQYELFGVDYAANNSSDAGTVIKEEKLHISERNKLRKLFQQTITLRNSQVGNRT